MLHLIEKIVVPLLVLTSLAAGQQGGPDQVLSLKGLSLEELGNIEVTTVSKSPVTVARTPAAIYVITQDDIRRSGARILPEALRLAPGVEVARIDGVKWAIGIRGFESRLSRNVLVLIDGRSVYSPLFHGVYWEVQDTLMDDIERIEVIRGPGGIIWGANAVNGVINIITKSSRDTHGALIKAEGGNVDQGFMGIRYGGGNAKFNYRFYGKGSTRDAEFHRDDRQFDDFRRAQGGFRTDWSVTGRDSVTVQGDIYNGAAGESAFITRTTPPSVSILDMNGRLAGGNLLANWKRDLGGGSDFQIQTYYDHVSRQQPNQAEFRNTFDIDLVHHLNISDRQNLIWGLGARLSAGDVPTVVPTYVFDPSHRVDQLYSAFLQDEIQLVRDRLSLTFGTKVIHSSYTGLDAEPSVRLLFTPSTRRTVWTALTRAVRTPSDIEDTLTNTTLRSGTPVSFSRVTGDHVFTAETVLGYEAGYRQLVHPRLSIDFSGFYNSYQHLLSLEPGIPFTDPGAGGATIYPFVNRNGVLGSTAGVEITANWKPWAWWRVEGSYAWLNVDMRTRSTSKDTSTVATLEGSSPAHQVVAQSYIGLPAHFEFSQVFRTVSALPAQRVPLYQTGDARVAWNKYSHLELALTGQNLLQPHHPEFAGDPGPLVGIRRSVYGSVTWRQ